MNTYKTIKSDFTRIYFLQIPEGYCMIDTSYHQNYKSFKKKLKSIGINLSEIKYIFLTHHHDDHAGFLSEIVSENEIKVILHENALKYLKEGHSETESKPINNRVKVFFWVFSKFHKFEFPFFIPRSQDYIINGDNDTLLKSIGIEGKILHTPGHTKDGLTLLLDNGDAFVGDLAMSSWKMFKIHYFPIYIQSIEETKKSWKKVLNHHVKTVYPCHGLPFDSKILSENITKY